MSTSFKPGGASKAMPLAEADMAMGTDSVLMGRTGDAFKRYGEKRDSHADPSGCLNFAPQTRSWEIPGRVAKVKDGPRSFIIQPNDSETRRWIRARFQAQVGYVFFPEHSGPKEVSTMLRAAMQFVSLAGWFSKSSGPQKTKLSGLPSSFFLILNLFRRPVPHFFATFVRHATVVNCS
jgi:hypothetical protein